MLSGPELPGWKVSIVDKDGNPFPEHEVVYSAPEDGLPRVTCYLECEEDKEFSIFLQTPGNTKTAAKVDCHVDGVAIEGWAVSRGGSAVQGSRSEIYQRSDNGSIAKASLKFGKLIRKEDGEDEGLQQKAVTKQLGEIRACIFTGVKGRPYTIARAPSSALHSSVSERAKKALVGHSVQTANARTLATWELYHSVAQIHCDTPGRPQMTFIFRASIRRLCAALAYKSQYRSRRLLEALRVIRSDNQPAQDVPDDVAVPRSKKRKSGDMLAGGGQVIEVKGEVKREVKPRIDDDDGIVFLRESKSGHSSRKVIDFVDLDSDED